jgi:copper chaperone CopZ
MRRLWEEKFIWEYVSSSIEPTINNKKKIANRKLTKREKFMKKILIIALSLLTLNFAANAQSNKTDKVSEVKLAVNVHCDNCKQKIEKSIPYEKGIKDVVVSIENKQVTVKYDNTKTDTEKIKGLFKKLGYEAEIAKETAEVKAASSCPNAAQCKAATAQGASGCCKK